MALVEMKQSLRVQMDVALVRVTFVIFMTIAVIIPTRQDLAEQPIAPACQVFSVVMVTAYRQNGNAMV